MTAKETKPRHEFLVDTKTDRCDSIRCRLGHSGSARRGVVLDQYIAAFEDAEPSMLEKALRHDAALEMIGSRTWFAGRTTCLPFIATQVLGSPGDWRVLLSTPTASPPPPPTTRRGWQPACIRDRCAYRQCHRHHQHRRIRRSRGWSPCSISRRSASELLDRHRTAASPKLNPFTTPDVVIDLEFSERWTIGQPVAIAIKTWPSGLRIYTLWILTLYVQSLAGELRRQRHTHASGARCGRDSVGALPTLRRYACAPTIDAAAIPGQHFSSGFTSSTTFGIGLK
jgi:hypothetical protein